MKYFTLLAPALAAAAPSLHQVRDVPDPEEIQILSATWSGNGCPADTVSTSLSPDRTVITFGFDAFQTYIGPDVPPGENSKNCAIHLTLRYPGGYQFAMVETTYHGYAQLEEGIRGSFISSYFFSEDADATSVTRVNIDGGGVWAEGQVYTRQDEVPTASMIYSPCGTEGMLNINNRIALVNTGDNDDAFGSITDDDATVAFTQQLNVAWRECEAN